MEMIMVEPDGRMMDNGLVGASRLGFWKNCKLM